MNKVAKANRKYIGIYGKRNAGKSSIMNSIIGQDVSIVSHVLGTTTDPVEKTMELIPFGPVVFVDTAGIDDKGYLGDKRVEKSFKQLQMMDFILYVVDGSTFKYENIQKDLKYFEPFKIPVQVIVNKIDLIDSDTLNNLKNQYPEYCFVQTKQLNDILNIKNAIIEKMTILEKDPVILGDILNYGDTVIFVVPIDSEAPKGRIILPQVQCIRDSLDHGVMSYVVRDTELSMALKNINKVDLVVTDSQAFKAVKNILPKNISLTSFSILFAKHKGDLKEFVDGVKALDNIKTGAKILISESCTHNFSHEDIGRVKLPNLIKKYTGKNIEFVFCMGKDFPTKLDEYELIIHCGSCMLNRKTMLSRIAICKDANIPITNYGVVIAFVNGILSDSIKMFGVH